jgi:uncharacterized protein YlzI (FlbEa/FlbD family)
MMDVYTPPAINILMISGDTIIVGETVEEKNRFVKGITYFLIKDITYKRHYL